MYISLVNEIEIFPGGELQSYNTLYLNSSRFLNIPLKTSLTITINSTLFHARNGWFPLQTQPLEQKNRLIFIGR